MGGQFSIPILWSLCSGSVGAYSFKILVDDLTLAVWVQLPLGRNTCLLFSSDIVSFVWKINEGEAESIVLLIFDIWRCFNCRWVRGGGSYLGPVVSAVVSAKAICMTYSG